MRCGVRCADTIRHSCGTPSAVKVSDACRMVAQSDWLPITMPTFGAAVCATCACLLMAPPAARREAADYRSGRGRRKHGIPGIVLTAPAAGGRLQIGRAHVGTPVTNAHLVCRLLLVKYKYTNEETTTS